MRRRAAARKGSAAIDAPHPLDFFGKLVWLDGRPLLKTIEPYRRETFERVLFSFDDGGRLKHNFALIGRAKKNNKTSDLILAALYRLLAWPSDAGNDCFILANDEGQAGDDLALAKKLADRLVFLYEAKAIFFGTFADMAKCQEPIVQEFLELDSMDFEHYFGAQRPEHHPRFDTP